MNHIRQLYRLDEAAEKYFGGDREVLRQAVSLHGLAALIEHNGSGWFWPDEETPNRGEGEYSRWRLSKNFNPADDTPDEDGVPCQLAGWFYVSREFALRLLEGEQLPDMSSYVFLNENMEPWQAFAIHGRMWKRNDLWFLASDIEALFASPVAAKQEKPLSTRERNNLLRIIAALAKHAEVDITEGSDGAAKVDALIAAAGFDGPKVKTIREVLAAARDLG